MALHGMSCLASAEMPVFAGFTARRRRRPRSIQRHWRPLASGKEAYHRRALSPVCAVAARPGRGIIGVVALLV